MKAPLYAQVNQKPLQYALIFWLTAILCIAFPIEWMSGGIGVLNARAIVRAAFGAIGIALILLCGQKQSLSVGKAALKNWDLILAGLLIAAVNFPIFPLASGGASVSAGGGQIAAYVFYCLSIGLFEELFFRGLIFSALLIYFKNKKFGALWAVLISSAAFGLTHLINLAGGNPVGAVLMQVGYTFLTGMLYAVIYYAARSVWFPVLCHALYNAGGFLIQELGSGSVWTAPAVAVTVGTAVLAAAYVAFRFLRMQKQENTEKTSPCQSAD